MSTPKQRHKATDKISGTWRYFCGLQLCSESQLPSQSVALILWIQSVLDFLKTPLNCTVCASVDLKSSKWTDPNVLLPILSLMCTNFLLQVQFLIQSNPCFKIWHAKSLRKSPYGHITRSNMKSKIFTFLTNIQSLAAHGNGQNWATKRDKTQIRKGI